MGLRIETHEWVKNAMVAAWPDAATVRRTKLDEYNTYRSLNGVSQHRWLFLDDDGGLYAVLIVKFENSSAYDLNIRLGASKERLKGLDEQAIAKYLIDLAEDLSTPRKVRQPTWDEATAINHRFASWVPFNFLARMHFLACLECGQNFTAQLVNSIVERLRRPCKKWKVPDLVSIEEGWDEEAARLRSQYRYYSVPVGIAGARPAS